MKFASILGVGLLASVAALGKDKKPDTYTIPLPSKPDFSALNWLVGEWTGKMTDKSPAGEVRMTVSTDLGGRFMVLREEIRFDETQDMPGEEESWMGILSPGRGKDTFTLRTFSSRGFIYRHGVKVDGDEIHFNPEGGDQTPAGWLLRRALVRTGDAGIKETVQVAPPDRSFFDYYSAELHRVSSPGEKPSDPLPTNSKSGVK